jgi:hypothetical protein
VVRHDDFGHLLHRNSIGFTISDGAGRMLGDLGPRVGIETPGLVEHLGRDVRHARVVDARDVSGTLISSSGRPRRRPSATARLAIVPVRRGRLRRALSMIAVRASGAFSTRSALSSW